MFSIARLIRGLDVAVGQQINVTVDISFR